MTTFTLTVVIIVLTCNLAILYLPFDKKKKAKLGLITGAFGVICALSYNAWNHEAPVYAKEIAARNETAQKAMMATFNVAEEKLDINTSKPTPIEQGVSIVLAFALVFTPLLLHVVKDNNDKETEMVHKVTFTLNAVASALLLSLYFGLKLTIVPWIKTSVRNKLSPMSVKEELA